MGRAMFHEANHEVSISKAYLLLFKDIEHTFSHKYLCTQLFETIVKSTEIKIRSPLKAVFKQLNPCLNHGTYVLFEHVCCFFFFVFFFFCFVFFFSKILKTGRRLFT